MRVSLSRRYLDLFTKARAADNQTLDAIRSNAECAPPVLVQPRRNLAYRARPQSSAGNFTTRHILRIEMGDVAITRPTSDVGGRSLAQNVEVYVNSPTLRLSRLTSFSRSTASSFGRARRPFSATSRKRSRTLPPPLLSARAAAPPQPRRLILEQADYQCGTTLGRPALPFFWPLFFWPLFFCHWPPHSHLRPLTVGGSISKGPQDKSACPRQFLGLASDQCK
jgi:hypothetical protein